MSLQPAPLSALPFRSDAPAAPLTTPRPLNDRAGDLLALAFATSVAMWTFGYVGHAPFASLPSAPFVALMLLCVIAGGFLTARHTSRGISGGALVGALSAILNLLILGSVIKDPDTGKIVPSHLLWMPMSILFQAALGALGAALGSRFPGRRDINWKALLWLTFVILTLVLIAAGGLVTGFGAGLAVPDWPNSYGSNMILYPLKSMIEFQGKDHKGIFYEHAHRLLGMFVGVCSLVGPIYLTVLAWRRPASRSWFWGIIQLARNPLVIMSWGLFLAVCLQGAVFGALRVIGHYNLSTLPQDQHPSDALALAHGIAAHAILAGFTVITVLCYNNKPSATNSPTSSSSSSSLSSSPSSSSSSDLQLAWLLAALVFIQSLIGGFVRHFNELVMLHITIAALVALFALFTATRAIALHKQTPILRRHGFAILLILLAQLTLGIIALIVRTPDSPHPAPLAAIITTLHQTNAALLLATTVSLAVWTARLLPARQLQGFEVAAPAVS